MKAVVRKLFGCDIIPHVTGLNALHEQPPDELGKPALRSGDVLISMQQGLQFGGVTLVLNERVRLEHRFESLGRVPGPIAEFGETFEVASDVTLVPGDQDGFDAIVLVLLFVGLHLTGNSPMHTPPSTGTQHAVQLP